MKLLVAWNRLTKHNLKQIKERTEASLFVSQNEKEALEVVSDVQVIFGSPSQDVIKKAVNCRWIQSPLAGTEKILAAEWGNPKMVVTNGSGVFGPPIGEQVVGFLLSFNRGLHLARDYQNRRFWQEDFDYPFTELTGATVGILGYGDIGGHIAKRLLPFGCHIIGFRKNPAGNEPYAHEVHSVGALDDFLGRLDYLICVLPHTEETIGFLHKKRLRRLPKHAVIVNVGRGTLIAESDLIYALQKGWIRGAALDVTDPEPLAAESPLWAMDNVIITPHISGFTPFHVDRILDIFFENWDSFAKKGRPKRNVVSRQLGY